MQAGAQRGWPAPVHDFFAACLGDAQLARVADALARAPASTCIRCSSLEGPGGNAAVAARLKKAALELGADASPHPRLPLAVVVRSRASATPRREDDDAGETAAAIVVNRRAGEAVLKGAELYVPGVLACSGGVLAGDAVEIFAAVEARPGEEGARGPDATVALVRGTTLPSPSDFQRDAAGEGEDEDDAAAAESVAAAIARRAAREGGWVAVPIGAGRAQMTRSQMFAADRGLAVRVERRAGAGAPPPPAMDSLLPAVRGQAMQQNLPSIVAALALSPPPGSRVLDMCSAPGGKTTLLAWMVAGGMAMQQQQQQEQQQQQQEQEQQQPGGSGGVVIALDRTHAKADEIRSLARELGVGHIVDARKMDATQCCLPDGGAEQQTAAAAAAAARADDSSNTTNNDNNNQQEQQQVNKKRPRGARQEQGGASGSGGSGNNDPRSSAAAAGAAAAAAAPILNAKALARACRRIGVMRARGILTPDKIVLEMRRNNLPEPLAPTIAEAAEEAAVAALADGADEPRVVAAVAEAASAAAVAAAAQATSTAAAAAAERLPAGSFSHILLDAPCSAMGLRPRLVQPHTLASLRRAAQYQRQLLRQAVRLLAPGGALVFSTCSISPLENEANVRWTLDRFPEMRLVAPPPASCPVLGGPGLVQPADRQAARDLLRAHGRDDNDDDDDDDGSNHASLDADLRWLTPEEAPLVQRFCPAGPEDTIGFFIARFEKAA